MIGIDLNNEPFVPVRPGTPESRIDAFVDACRRQNMRVTHQRMEIYRELAATEEHPGVDTIYRRVRRRIPMISLDTVYRNLKLLAERGLISVVGLSEERLRFDANIEPHHHFVCVSCGAIRDFTSPDLAKVGIPAGAKRLGKPVSVHLEVKGVCGECEANGGRRGHVK